MLHGNDCVVRGISLGDNEKDGWGSLFEMGYFLESGGMKFLKI